MKKRTSSRQSTIFHDYLLLKFSTDVIASDAITISENRNPGIHKNFSLIKDKFKIKQSPSEKRTMNFKKWVDAPPPHQDCPRQGWKWFIETSFVNKKGGNTHYRTDAQITDMIRKLIPHEKFIEEYAKAKKNNKGKQFKKMPPRLEELRSKAREAGKINTNLWKLKHSKNGEISLLRKATATVDGKRKEVYWSVKAVEKSYDLLYKIHCKEGHCTGHELWRYCERKQLYSYPREMISKFQLYCKECRSDIILKQKKKVEDNYGKKTTELKEIFDGVARNNISRQGRFFWFKIWNFDIQKETDETNSIIVSQLCMESGLILSCLIERIEKERIVSTMMEIFSHGMCAADIAIEYPKKEGLMLPNEESVSIQHVLTQK